MRLPIGEGENPPPLIGIAPPGIQDLLGQFRQATGIAAIQANDAHRPLHNSCLNVLEAPESNRSLHGSRLHGEGIVAALEMLMAQDGAAHNGQVRIGAHKIVGEQHYKIQQLIEGGPINFHRHVPAVEDDAVLIVIDIG